MIRIQRETGAQTLLSTAPVDPVAVAISRDGSILVTDDDSSEVVRDPVKRIDPLTGASSTVASGPNLFLPGGIAIDSEDNLYVNDRNTRRIVRIDANTSEQTVLPATLVSTFGMDFDGAGDILLADFNADSVFRVDTESGAKTLIAPVPRAPFGLALAADGSIILVDQIGGVLRVDPLTGTWTMLAPMFGATGVAIFPVPEPSTALLVGLGLAALSRRAFASNDD